MSVWAPGLAALVLLVSACGRALPADREATLGDGGPELDAGVDASAPPDSVPIGGDCTNLAADDVLVLSPDKKPALVRNVVSSTPIGRSVIDLVLTVSREATPWAGGYFGLLTLGYGAGYDYASVPVTSFAVAPEIEGNVWRQAGTGGAYYEFKSLEGLTLPDGEITIHAEVTWGDPGSITMAVNGDAKTTTARTLSAPKQDRLTVVIGGGVSGSFPTHTLVVKKLCVTLE